MVGRAVCVVTGRAAPKWADLSVAGIGDWRSLQWWRDGMLAVAAAWSAGGAWGRVARLRAVLPAGSAWTESAGWAASAPWRCPPIRGVPTGTRRTPP